MKTFRIDNMHTGATMGEYKAESEQQALDAMACDIGYEDYAQACEAVAVAPPDLRVIRIDCESVGIDDGVAGIIAAKREHEDNQIDPDDTFENWIATQFNWTDVEITRQGEVVYTALEDCSSRRVATAEQCSEILALYQNQ
ncbi:hypothetical protein [Telmatospirillum sp.]|uniref:hypothetical protein n=1 Tax=Telmatospirillum sp. TaxID=2079197 RepID=UPI00283E80C8|nr:hypothetical protein [Telmatospirillum sp.]MDR3441220.1 hypothetical protein [Telmatospirillum sp.]